MVGPECQAVLWFVEIAAILCYLSMYILDREFVAEFDLSNSAYKCSLCKNLLISGQGSDMVLGFETKVCLRLHTDAFSTIQESQKLT